MNDLKETLHIAAQFGRLDEIRKLIESGIDVNVKDNDGYTALHWACQEGHEAVVELLLSFGADIESEDNEGFKVLEIACTKGHTNIVNTLIINGVNLKSNREGFTALHAAAATCREEICSILIGNGLDANIKDANGEGRTPLHWAAQEGCIGSVRILVESGSDIEAREEETEYTPLMIAIAEGHVEIVDFLMDHGAAINIKCPENNDTTPLHLACAWNQTEIVKRLIRSGAETEIRDAEGKRPIDVAIENNNSQIVQMIKGTEESGP